MEPKACRKVLIFFVFSFLSSSSFQIPTCPHWGKAERSLAQLMIPATACNATSTYMCEIPLSFFLQNTVPEQGLGLSLMVQAAAAT